MRDLSALQDYTPGAIYFLTLTLKGRKADNSQSATPPVGAVD